MRSDTYRTHLLAHRNQKSRSASSRAAQRRAGERRTGRKKRISRYGTTRPDTYDMVAALMS
jgi:hypothetical protein